MFKLLGERMNIVWTDARIINQIALPAAVASQDRFCFLEAARCQI